MTNTDVNVRKKHFHEDMVKYFKLTAKEVKYKPTRRLDLINKYGGYEAAIKMLPTDSNTFDFTLLWEAQRLDLSIEALVTKPIYKDLFPDHIADFCQKRLDEYNYAPKKIIEVEEEPEITPYVPEEEPVKDQAMLDFVDLFFENDGEGLPQEQPKDAISEALTEEVWKTLLDNPKVFTEANKDFIIKIAQLKGALTPQTLNELEGYNSAYPVYNVINTLAKRIKRLVTFDLESTGVTDKECWQLLFNGESTSPKEYKWYLRSELKNIFAEKDLND